MPRPHRSRPRGIAMIWALFATMVIAGIIASGTTSFLAVESIGAGRLRAPTGRRAPSPRRASSTRFAWFRRQQTQPVTTFAPAAQPGRRAGRQRDRRRVDRAHARLRDHAEPLGPVRGAQDHRRRDVHRLERERPATTTASPSPTPTATASATPPARRATSASSAGLPGAGAVWRIESRGTVYSRPDPALALGAGAQPRASPSVTVAAEIRRLAIVPPATAAVCVEDAARHHDRDAGAHRRAEARAA